MTRKATILCATICSLAFVEISIAAMQWSQNLLINPGAEIGTLQGWTAEVPVVASRSQKEATGWVYPNSGGWFFNMAGASVAPSGVIATRLLYQDVDLSGYASDIDAGLLQVHASTFLQTEDYIAIENADYARLTLYFLDAREQTITSLSTGLVQSPNLTWIEKTLEGFGPAGTRTIRFELLGEKHESSYINAFFDDTNLQIMIVPEPTCLALLGLGGLALLKKRLTK